MTGTPTRIRRDDVYNGLKPALNILTIVAKLSPIPQFDGLISAVKSIMDDSRSDDVVGSSDF